MERKGSRFAQFVKRIPIGLSHKLAGRELLVPLGEGITPARVKFGSATQAVRFSLRTSDPSEIRQRQAAAAGFIEEVFASLRQDRPLSLSRSQVMALAGELYRAWAEEQPPSGDIAFIEVDGKMVRTYDFDGLDDEAEIAALEQTAERLPEGNYAAEAELEKIVGPLADRLLARKAIMAVDARTRDLIVRSLPRALADGMRARAKTIGGNFAPDETGKRFPTWRAPEASRSAASQASGTLSLTDLVDAWWSEAKAAGKTESTHDSYSNSFRLLSAFLGHDDARLVSPEDIIRFKDHRLTTPNPKTGRPVSAKTVKASDLTAFKSVFDWAVANRKLPSNPAVGITIKLGKTVKVRERDFTDAEAVSILSKANQLSIKNRLSETEEMKRWVPWLCAYSGARLGEMVQLRKEDLRQEGEDWIITITPEAGTVKGKESREVPLHPHLVEMGFPEFVRRRPSGYLFMTIKKDKTFRGTWRGKKNRMVDFARDAVKDPNVAPNHAWRHTFKQKGFEAGIQEKVLDAICGHAPASVGRTYGSVSLKTKIKAIATLPRYKLETCVSGRKEKT